MFLHCLAKTDKHNKYTFSLMSYDYGRSVANGHKLLILAVVPVQPQTLTVARSTWSREVAGRWHLQEYEEKECYTQLYYLFVLYWMTEFVTVYLSLLSILLFLLLLLVNKDKYIILYGSLSTFNQLFSRPYIIYLFFESLFELFC